MNKIRTSILNAATHAVANLRATADRLERAIQHEDFDALSEIALSSTSWTLDAIRGAALVIARSEETKR